MNSRKSSFTRLRVREGLRALRENDRNIVSSVESAGDGSQICPCFATLDPSQSRCQGVSSMWLDFEAAVQPPRPFHAIPADRGACLRVARRKVLSLPSNRLILASLTRA